MQIGGANPAIPAQAVPSPQQRRIGVARANGVAIDTAGRLLESWVQQLPRLTGEEALKAASPEAREHLRKSAGELKQQLADLEKRLERAAAQPADNARPAGGPAQPKP